MATVIHEFQYGGIIEAASLQVRRHRSFSFGLICKCPDPLCCSKAFVLAFIGNDPSMLISLLVNGDDYSRYKG